MKYLSIFLVSLTLWSCSEKEEVKEGPFINLTVKNSSFPNVFLVAQNEDQFDTISTIPVTEEPMQIPYSVEYPELMYLAFENFSRPLQIFVDEDGIDVNIDFGVNPPDKKITGSIYNEKLDEFYEIEASFSNNMRSLQPLRIQAQADPIVADILKEKEDSLYNDFKKKSLEFCYRSDLVGAFIANRRIFDITYQQADSVYQNIQAKHRKSVEVTALKDKIEVLKLVAVGNPTLDINQNTIVDKPISLDAVVKENKYTLLHFWASWHQPSRIANIGLRGIYNTYHDKGFEIYSVSLDEDKAQWEAAISQDSLIWPNVSNLTGIENEAGKKYGIYYLPQSVLINNNGIIEVKNLTEEDLKQYLDEKL